MYLKILFATSSKHTPNRLWKTAR